MTEVERGLQRGLENYAPTEIELYTEYLDAVRFPSPEYLQRQAEGLAAKYKDTPPYVLFAVGPGALRFMIDHRDEIAPGKPLIFGGISQETAKAIQPGSNIWGVVSRFDVARSLDLAMSLQPRAKKVVVLTGSSAFDRSWQTTARKILGDRYKQVPVEYMSGLSLEGFKLATAELPADAILLILTVLEDADGRKYVSRDAVAEIVPVSGAPAYSVYSVYIGVGVVGGFVETLDRIGEDMANLAKQLLSGTPQAPRVISSTAIPVVDWRQMKRWGIDRTLLPADAELQFYEPTAWEKYRLQILATLAVLILQTSMIAALIVQGRRRRRVEQELTLERLELAHLSRRSQLGELSGAFAHELNQPLTSILANAEAGARLLGREPPDTPELMEIFGDIIANNKRAAGVIAQLRRLMVKGETRLDQMDLNEAVAATIELAGSELVARQTRLDFNREQPELAVRGSLAQLQQIVLNLILNAAEAMADLAPSQRRIMVNTRLRDDGFRELSVSDRGPGLSPEMTAKAFKPFVSTKTEGLGLGLAICRSIAEAHGGTLQFDEQKSDGARIVLALPSL